MPTATHLAFRNTADHQAVSAIIRRRSTNRRDIRDVVLERGDFSSARRVLDLGCGFGYMTGRLAPRTPLEAHFLGIDAWEENRAPWLERVTAAGRSAEFATMDLNRTLPWPDDQFDLVLCSFSLYFFVDVLPEIARVLAPGGQFLTVTHSARNVEGPLPDAGFAEAAERLHALTRVFSAENGAAKLAEHFGQVQRVDYRNQLRFAPEHVDELLAFLRFKAPLLVPGAQPGDDLPREMEQLFRDLLRDTGEFTIEKNDAAFHCQEPQCH